MSDTQDEFRTGRIVHFASGRVARSPVAQPDCRCRGAGRPMHLPGAGRDLRHPGCTADQALPEGTKMVAIGVITPFMVPLKVTAMVAFVLALPFILYQVWAFIAPGFMPMKSAWAFR
jgi:hypothetical protein